MAYNPTTQLTNPELTNIPYKVRKFLDALVKACPLYSTVDAEAIPTMEGLSAQLWRLSEATPNFAGSAPGALVAGRTLEDSTVNIPTLTYSDAIILAKVFSEQAHIKAKDAAYAQIKQLAQYVVEYVLRSAIDNFCVDANINLFASNGAATVGALVAADTMQWSDVQKMWARLDASGVKKVDNEYYTAVLHSSARWQIGSSIAAGSFSQQNYSNAPGYEKVTSKQGFRPDSQGFVRTFDGLNIYSTPLMTTANDGNAGLKVAYSAFYGKESVGCVELQADSNSDHGFDIIELQGQGLPGIDSTAEMRTSVAYRFTQGALVLSEDHTSINKQRVLRMASPTGIIQ